MLRPSGCVPHHVRLKLAFLFCCLWSSIASADPVTFFTSFAGNIDYQITGGTLRTQSNAGNACAVTTGPVTATLSGIPGTATITAAYLYWSGSGPTPDINVTFEGNNLTADTTYTENFTLGFISLDYFAGVRDVTAIVSAKAGGPNGTYTFSDLTVTNTDIGGGGIYCSVAAVYSGWGLIVIYSDPAEDLRVINLFDGLQAFRGSDITLSPSNFVVPASPINGKLAVLSWEGDVGNSATLNGFTEDIAFNGVDQTDGFNPVGNQFNSTINVLGSSTTYGVDFDLYDISPYLTAGDTSATTVYSSGGDLVLLALEAISTTNTPVADLAITKSLASNLIDGGTGQYLIQVSNNGPSNVSGGDTITVTDTLDGNLTYTGFSSTGSWNCNAVGQNITCTHPGPLNTGNALDDLLIDVSVAAGTAGTSITNDAVVSSTVFDNIAANNTGSTTDTVVGINLTTSVKRFTDINGGEADVGDTILYEIELIESGGLTATGVQVTDNIPAGVNSFTVTSWPTGSSNNSLSTGGTNGTGFLDISNITVPANSSVLIQYRVVIDGSSSPGDTIANLADIAAPPALVQTIGPVSYVVSPSQVPSSGTKNLYMYFNSAGGANANTLQRIVPPANNNSGNVTTFTLTMTPDLVRDLTLTSGNITIPMCLRRRNGGGTRNVQATLAYTGTSSGTIGSQTQNNILGNNAWQLITFNINLPSDTTLLTGSRLEFTITSLTGQNIRARAFPIGACTVNPSAHIQLATSTVINVENVEVHDVAWPGVNAVTEVTDDGSTIYARALVSDPFGSFDITGATITIDDSTPATIIGPSAMTEVNDNVAAGEKTYELSFTTPTFTNSPYTLTVVADEGSEGTVTDTGVGGLVVNPLLPNLSVTKTADKTEVASGGTILYTIEITNLGPGPASSVIIEDDFDNLSSFGLDTFGAGVPILFTDGVPSSGLTMGTAVYSSNDGISFAHTLTSGAGGAPPGYDGLATDFQLPFSGTMPALGTFQIQYEVIAD